MRKVIIVALVVAALIAGAIIYLVVSTPSHGAGIRFPLTGAQRALLAMAPASAEEVALIPSAAAFHARLLENRVTRDPVESWTTQQSLPQPWLIGAADLVAWRIDKQTSYAIRVDSFRALFLRLYLMVTGNSRARFDHGMLLINADELQPASSSADVDALLATLPPGDALIVQRDTSRGAFPPIARPTVTSLHVTPSEIDIVSHARATDAPSGTALSARFATGALLSATFARPPSLISDLNRLFGSRVASLLDQGGSVVLYNVDTGTLLPRPNGLLIVPSDADRRAAAARISTVAEAIGEMRDTGTEILISVDRSSMAAFTADHFANQTWPATEWAARVDPRRLVPILESLGDSMGLRLAAPRMYRSVRDLRGWIRHLAVADSIEAARSISGGIDQMSVKIVSRAGP